MNYTSTRSGRLSLLWFTLRKLLDWLDPQPPCPPCPPERTRISFVPGQICLLAEYPADAKLDRAEIARQVLDGLAERRLLSEKLNLPAERVVVLRGRTSTLATLFGDVPAAQKDPARLLRFVTQLNTALADNQRPPYEQGKQEPPYQREMEERPEGPQAAAFTTFSATSERPAQPVPLLRLATPNWLTGGAPKNMGGGGPGTWPVQAAPPIGEPWRLHVTMPAIAETTSEPPVTIAILDTAPPAGDFANAYDAWVGNTAQPPIGTLNDLLAELIAPNGALDLSGAGRLEVTYGSLVHLPDASFADHDYEMSDHGLFVAGLIHSLAPQTAKVHLIEVLNHYGIGTIESIAHGFQVVLDRWNASGGPLVVNCSLVISIPQANQPAIDQQASSAPDVESLTPPLVEQMAALPAEIFGLVGRLSPQQQIAIVAAAGNDGKDGQHPWARFPAAYDGIVGVGALASSGDPASYSNLSDDPPNVGYATFGGNSEASTAEDGHLLANDTNGILGLYIGKLPTQGGATLNTNGWARWAGTSFAAPIISGVLAQRLALGEQAPQALQALEGAAQPRGLNGIGDTFTVTQG